MIKKNSPEVLETEQENYLVLTKELLAKLKPEKVEKTGFNTTTIKNLGDLLEPLKSTSVTVDRSPIPLPNDIIWVKCL